MKTIIWLSIVPGLLSLVQGQSNDLQLCLTSTQDMKVITSSDGTYSNVSQPFNLRITPSPAAIVYPYVHRILSGKSSLTLFYY